MDEALFCGDSWSGGLGMSAFVGRVFDGGSFREKGFCFNSDSLKALSAGALFSDDVI
jgi:hypothetical protein